MTAKPNVRTARYALKAGRMFASGSYRKVYKTVKAKWVYKVDREDTFDQHGNREEYQTYLSMKDLTLPEGVKIPEMHLLNNGVLAAEYIQGETPPNWCSSDYHASNCTERNHNPRPCWARKFAGMDITVKDLHNGNVVVTENGDVYIVDLGHGLIKKPY